MGIAVTPLRRRPKKPVVITRVQTGFCQLFATFEMKCPRCGVIVPAKTEHRCGTERQP
jgi:hypothetical protein